MILQSGTGAGAIYINTSNNVGIGTSTASNLLTIGTSGLPAANSAGTTALLVYGGMQLYGTRLCFSNAANDWNHCIYNNNYNLDNEGIANILKYNGYNGHLFRIGATNGLFIGKNGVGIGTSSSSTPLLIYEATSTAPSATYGTIYLTHASGQSSICFPSYNNYPSDYGAITFYETTPTIAQTGATYTQSLLFDCQNDPDTVYGPDSVLVQPTGNIAIQPGGTTYFVGSVGIGITNPSYKLHVIGSGTISGGIIVNGSATLLSSSTVIGNEMYLYNVGSKSGTSVSFGDGNILPLGEGRDPLNGGNMYYTGSSDTVVNYGSPSIAIYTNGDIQMTGNLFIVSDRRIKRNLQPILHPLSMLQSLEFVSYDLIDQPTSWNVGLIAQQVKTVLPDSIFFTSNFIPNVCTFPSSVQLISDRIELQFNTSVDLVAQDRIKCIVITKTEQTEYITVVSYANQNIIRFEPWPQFAPTDQLFVYGKEIHDFHNVDKDMIGLLGLAGVQELDTLLSLQYQEINQLEQEFADIRSTIPLLQARIAALS